MAKKRKPQRCFLDTSAVIYELHGHSLQRAAVREAVSGKTVEVPVLVRMEYLRGVVLNLIEMWCLIRESITVRDAFVDWSQKVCQDRKLKVVLMTVPGWLTSHEGWRSKEITLRRLGELILRLVWDFDEGFVQSAADPLACVLGRVDIPRQEYDPDLLLDFYERFKAVQEGMPDCNLCEFRRTARRRLRRQKYGLIGPDARSRHAANRGYQRQADVLEEVERTKEKNPQCRWCERLGDSLISLQAGRGVAVVTADLTFTALGDLLGQPVILLPSLAELKRRLVDTDILREPAAQE